MRRIPGHAMEDELDREEELAILIREQAMDMRHGDRLIGGFLHYDLFDSEGPNAQEKSYPSPQPCAYHGFSNMKQYPYENKPRCMSCKAEDIKRYRAKRQPPKNPKGCRRHGMKYFTVYKSGRTDCTVCKRRRNSRYRQRKRAA